MRPVIIETTIENIHKIYYDRNLNPVLTDHVKIKTGMKRGLAHKFHGPFKVLAKLPIKKIFWYSK